MGSHWYAATVTGFSWDEDPCNEGEWWITADYDGHPYGLVGGFMSVNDREIAYAEWRGDKP